MLRKITLFLFLSFFLYASSPSAEDPVTRDVSAAEAESFWKHHHLASVGYRRDRQKWSEIATKAAYTDRNSLQLILGSYLEWHRIVLSLTGRYGWLVNGNFHFSAPGSRFSEPLFFGQMNLGAGYSADAIGTAGIRIPLCNCKDIGISLIPSGGYQYSHLMNFPEGERRFALPDPPALLPAGTSGFALARFPNPNQQDWFGPFIEGRLEFRFWQNCDWNLFYQYHWPSVRSKSKEEIDLYLFNPPATVTAIELFRTASIYRANYIEKQLAGTELKYRTPSGWNFGLYFEGSSAWTHKARYKSKMTREQYLLFPTGVTTASFDEPASIHWVCYQVNLSLGYQF